MAVKRVLKMGDPLLYCKAEPVEPLGTPALDSLRWIA